MLDIKYPGLSDFRQHMVSKVGQLEVVRIPLFDSVIYPTAGAAALAFFSSPVGQGASSSPGNANAVKSIADTNLSLAGQLPQPQGFFIDSIEVDFQPGSSAAANTFLLQPPSGFDVAAATTLQDGENDVNAFYTAGALELTVGTKVYAQDAPLLKFPPQAGFKLEAALASNSATVGVSTRAKLSAVGAKYSLAPGISIPTGMNFGVTLRWPVGVATPSGFNGRAMCTLNGWLFRAVQ